MTVLSLGMQDTNSDEPSFLLIDSNESIVWADLGAVRLFGVAQDALRGMNLSNLIDFNKDSRSLDPVRDQLASVASGRTREARGEMWISHHGKPPLTVRWKMSTLAEVENGCAVLFSLWETKQPAVCSLENAGYRDIFQHAVEGLFRTSIEGHYLQVNPALAEMYGYGSPAEVIAELRDLNTQLYVQPTRRKEFIRLMQEQGFVSDFESEVRRADGTTIWIAEFGRIVYSESHRPTYFEGSVINITARKRAESALRQSEEKFRHLVEMTSVVPWEMDPETGLFTYVGPQAREFLGYPVEEWTKPDFWQRVVHSEDFKWVRVVRGEAIEQQQKFECEYRLLHAGGKIVWTREILSPLPGNDGHAAFGGFMLDVSHRRESEESLRESQHFIEHIAAASPTISYLYDPRRRQCMYVNGRVPDILGYSKDALSEMQPLFIVSLAHPDEVSAHLEYFDSWGSVSLRKVVEREFRLRNAGGGWVWFRSRECVFKRESHTGSLRVIGTIEDITLQKSTNDELRDNERIFRRLVETTGAVPFDFDMGTQRFTYVGPQAEEIFGHPLRSWFNLEFWKSFVHSDDLNEGMRFTREHAANDGKDFQTEFRVRSAGGDLLWVRQIVHRSMDEDARAHVRGYLFDVTAARLIEEERERSRIQLRALAARGQKMREEERVSIAREIHDELGKSLTLFTIDLSWLGSRIAKTVPEEAKSALQEKIISMEDAVHTTLSIVRRILCSLRPPLLDELGLKEAIEWQMQDFSKRVGVRYEVDATQMTSLSADAITVVFRIFQEILTNIARHAKASRIKVFLNEIDGDCVLRVEDNGVGFSEAELPGAKKFGLLGMRERAWSVGGEVEIRGTPGRGTSVSLRIPIESSPIVT